jgi:hypothetical protein
MAISTVRAQVNGTWHTLTYDSASGSYKATITAPGQTSFRQTGGYYNISVEATNTAGTKGTANASTLTSLRLVVKEKVAPVITILSPASGAFVTNNKQPVVFNIVDESNGSGINLSTLVVKQDGTAVASTAVVTTAITNGYSVTYTPASALLDGSHTVTISVSDNDGNAATAKSTTYKVDTVAPTLNVTAPADKLITATASLTVSGKTNDTTSSPVTVVITLNGTNQGTVTVATDGSFSKAVTLKEGSNTLVVKATDAAGKASSITRTVTLDTSVPKVTSATISPNPVDAGATMIISVVIEG